MMADGTAKITDFGIAKAVSDDTIISESGMVMGSVHYFSPEQSRGQYVDEKTDIYSLGVVLYEMLTGRVPFDADNPVTIAVMHMNDKIIPPSELVRSVPPGLEQIVLKATAKYQNDRFKNIDEMYKALDNVNFITGVIDDEEALGFVAPTELSEDEPGGGASMAAEDSEGIGDEEYDGDVENEGGNEYKNYDGDDYGKVDDDEYLDGENGRIYDDTGVIYGDEDTNAIVSEARQSKDGNDNGENITIEQDEEEDGEDLTPRNKRRQKRHDKKARAAAKEEDDGENVSLFEKISIILRKKDKNGLALWQKLLAILAAIVVAGVASYFISQRITGAFSERINMPNVIGAEEDEAVAYLEEIGFTVSVEYEEIDPEGLEAEIDVTDAVANEDGSLTDGASAEASGKMAVTFFPGMVMNQDPRPNEQVKKGSEILLTVAKAFEEEEEISKVPDLVGLAKDEAEKAIKDAGFRIGNVVDAASDKPVGEVISQTPKAGSELGKNKAVSYTFSRGPDAVTVPTVAGKTAADAKTALEAAGFVVGSTTEDWSDTYTEGQVIRTDPAAGTSAKKGATVNLVVSKGKGIKVPKLVGLSLSNAKAACEGVGLKFSSSERESSSATAGTVLEQSIAEGTVVAQDTSVSVVVAKAPAAVTPTDPGTGGTDTGTGDETGSDSVEPNSLAITSTGNIPYVWGMSEAKARAKLTAAGFTPNVRYAASTWAAGFVFYQEQHWVSQTTNRVVDILVSA